MGMFIVAGCVSLAALANKGWSKVDDEEAKSAAEWQQ